VDSGFNKVERDVFRTRLLHCKGKRSVRCTEREVSNQSLNKGDVFILDMGLALFLYNGVSANRYEKAKGCEMIQKIHNERGARGTITLIDEEPHNETFWSTLGGEIEVTDEGEDDDAAQAASLSEIRLLRVTDSTGEVTMTDIPRNDKGQFTRDMLDSSDAYILDAGSQLFVWTGRGSTKEERKESMQIAMKFIQDQGRPMHTPVERVVESGETSMFKSFFFQFDPVLTPAQLKPQSSGVASMPDQTPVDIAAMHNKAASETPVDDGSGSLQIWRIEDFKKVEVPPEKYGQFYGGDSYILLYTYKDARGKEQFIIYFWQGRDSSKDEIGASALLAKELDDEMGGAPVQVRVVQGKEPAHFRQLFKGTMVIHAGGRASGFKNVADADSFDDDGVSLFHVRGSNALNVCGVQTEEKAASLNSMDCFVLVTPGAVYSWHGTGALPEEVESADKIAAILKDHSYGPPGTAPPSREIIAVTEGDEDEAFWAALGGKGEYAQQPVGEPAPSEPRLFHCTNAYGKFQVEEVENFTQEDMLEDDVMLLDVGTAVYLWIGSGCNAEEKQKSMETAQDYNKSATDGRDPDIPIIEVKSGSEPLLFTQFFPGWDAAFAEKNKFIDPYEAKLAAIKKANEEAAAKEAAEAPAVDMAQAAALGNQALNPEGGFVGTNQKYSYAELTSGCPDGVDPTKKEQYLNDAEFQEKFGMTAAEFEKLAAWKRKKKKEEVGLF